MQKLRTPSPSVQQACVAPVRQAAHCTCSVSKHLWTAAAHLSLVPVQDEPVLPLQAGDFSGDGLTDLLLLSRTGVYGYQQVCLRAPLQYRLDAWSDVALLPLSYGLAADARCCVRQRRCSWVLPSADPSAALQLCWCLC